MTSKMEKAEEKVAAMGVPDHDIPDRPPHPFLQASCLSKLLFIWPYELMRGDKKSSANDKNSRDVAAIEESDLPAVLPSDSSEFCLEYFQAMWEREKTRATKNAERYYRKQQQNPQHGNSLKQSPASCKPSLHRAIAHDFLRSMWYVQPLMCASATAKLVQSLALGYLLQTFEATDDGSAGGSNVTSKSGYFWAGILTLCGFVFLMEHHHVFFFTWRKGMQYRIACIAAIYDKSLRLKSTSTTADQSISTTQKSLKKSKSTNSLSSLSLSKSKSSSNLKDKDMKSTASATFDPQPQNNSPPNASNTNNKPTTTTSGKIVNIATNDVERFLLATLFASYFIWVPLQSIAILLLGWHVIGWAFAAGFGLLLFVFVPLQLWLSQRFAVLRSKIALITDERVTMVSQAISGVRVMKMAGWEDNFETRIHDIRGKETEEIERVNRYRALNEAIFYVSNVATSVVIFGIHVAGGGILTPRNVFTTMTLINVAQMEITKHLSLAVMGVSECAVSITRIQRFLETPELEVQTQTSDSLQLSSVDQTQSAMVASNVICHWNNSQIVANPSQNNNIPSLSSHSAQSTQSAGEAENVGISNAIRDNDINNITTPGQIIALQNINLAFHSSELTCIIGEVGSGKSALLQMLAGELPLSSGSLHRNHCNESSSPSQTSSTTSTTSIAYAPQDPWIMDGTIQENILMGLPFHQQFYNQVVSACGLTIDFQQLRDGQHTIVGDRGVQLSGGQRARIALARAFYRNADVLLLDDPLSAVDAKVGRKLFYSAIIELGVKRGKCVVLATHQHQFIGGARCVLMDGGRVVCDGTYGECVDASGGRLMLAAQNEEEGDNGQDAGDADTANEDKENKNADSPIGEENDTHTSKDGSSNQSKSLKVSPQDTAEKPDGANEDSSKNLMSAANNNNNSKEEYKEQSMVGIVRLETFLNYLRAMPGGIWTGLFMLFLFTATQASVLACIASVGKWSQMAPQTQHSPTIMGIVFGLTLSVIFLAIVRAFTSFHLTIQASRRLHDDMTHAVLRARISFFDTNPLGRILNRFSSDVGSNDDLLPTTLFDFLVISFLVMGALVSAIVVLPVTLVFVPPLLWYFIKVRRTFVTTSRELKRLEGLARSPIFAMLSESLNGIATIRSNGALDYFRQKFFQVHDAHTRAFFAFIACSRWLGFRMDSLMFIFLAVASFAAVIVHEKAWFDIDPGILGLALSMLMQLSGLFQWCIRQSAEVVNQMVAVERVIGFRDLPSEAALVDEHDDELSPGWPAAKGDIDVQNLSVRYRPGLPLSLRGLTFKIDGGSRVGVVGRTGGGKSTLVQSLLRLLEAESGKILVDNVDISELGLHKLRRSISVIPQTPVLYGGCSLRDNLDPFHAHNDDQITQALKACGMLEAALSLPHGFDTVVAEGGLNFSVGQRQLLCLARAILRKNTILVLDEPTANVDSRTDKLLQEAISKSFSDATIIAVAHRLDTVIDYDRILVLGAGSVLEFGSPHELIEKRGAFASMVDDTGIEMSRLLRSKAREKFPCKKSV